VKKKSFIFLKKGTLNILFSTYNQAQPEPDTPDACQDISLLNGISNFNNIKL
jgi:hypothetical protein